MVRKFFMIALLAASAAAQTTDYRNVAQIGSWDASGAKQTKPNRAGSSLPGSCTNVETYQLTTTGALYVCVVGAWKQMSTPFTISGSDLTLSGTITATNFIGNLAGNASTVTNGVYTNGSYSDPEWLILSKAKVGLGNVENTALSSWTGSTNIVTLGTIVTGSFPWANIAGKPPIFTPSAHATAHQHNGADEVATATPSANAIPKAGAGGTLATGWFPILNQNTTGNAATATALAANGSNCPAGQVPLGVDAAGAAEGCYDPNTHRSGQINFVYGGSASTSIDATTVNNVWRAHAHYATITEVACWTDAGTVTLSVKDSAGNQVTSGTLACSSSGASTTSMDASYSLIGSGEGLGFTTTSVSGVKNLSVSIKYTRSY